MQTLIGRTSACREVSLGVAELRQSAGFYRPVRTGCVAFADDSLKTIMLSTNLGTATGDAPLAGCLLPLTSRLWVMRRMTPVPRIPSGPGMSYLARDDRPLRPIPSDPVHRFPQLPYYRFYYAAVASDVSDAQRTR